MGSSKVYAMPIVERRREWTFKVSIDAREVAFGPFQTRDEAAEMRRRVLERPGNWKELGGKIQGRSD